MKTITPWDAIVFDAFGTLVRISSPTRPYAALRAHLKEQGIADDPLFARRAMTARWALKELAQSPVEQLVLEDIDRAVAAEVASVVPFDDAALAIETALFKANKIIIASNLAWPYGAAVEQWLSQWGEVGALGQGSDARLLTAFSYDVGYVKPDPAFYRWVTSVLAAETHKSPSQLRLAMVGDKQAEDCDAPSAAGWSAWRVNRAQGQGLMDAPWWDEL